MWQILIEDKDLGQLIDVLETRVACCHIDLAKSQNCNSGKQRAFEERKALARYQKFLAIVKEAKRCETTGT